MSAQPAAAKVWPMLTQYFEEVARGNNVHTLRLETGIYQTEAIQLYERSG